MCTWETNGRDSIETYGAMESMPVDWQRDVFVLFSSKHQKPPSYLTNKICKPLHSIHMNRFVLDRSVALNLPIQFSLTKH